MMKKVKSTGKVGRSSFFDRIKMDSKQSSSMKENININHIRQSSYKLERSKSHRKGHSLERKIPIISAYTTENHKDISALRDITSQQNTVSCVPQEFTVRYEYSNNENKNCLNTQVPEQKPQTLGNSLNDLFKFLSCPLEGKSHSGGSQFNTHRNAQAGPYLLSEQQEMLEMIKTMWQVVIRMKQRQYFQGEVAQLQEVLKKIVLKIARPKLQILQECSNVSLKIPPFKYSSPGNIISFKEESRQNSIHHHPTDKEPSQWLHSDQNGNQEHSGQELEFKKIMYILEENQKRPQNLSKNKKVHIDSKKAMIQNKENYEPVHFKEAVTKEIRKSKSHLSSFNSQHTERTNPPLVYEQQKINNSYSNDKLYLKNIVKKAKNTLQTAVQPVRTSERPDEERSILDHVSTIPKELSLLTSEQTSKIIDEKSEYMPSLTQEVQDSQNESQSYQLSSSQSRQKQSFNTDGQSKRATLNNIINMLNKKYNKNIQMQPKK